MAHNKLYNPPVSWMGYFKQVLSTLVEEKLTCYSKQFRTEEASWIRGEMSSRHGWGG